MTFPDFMLVAPEIMMAVGAMVLLMIGAFGGERTTLLIAGLSLALLTAVAAVVVLQAQRLAPFGATLFSDPAAVEIAAKTPFKSGAFIFDSFAAFMKILTLIGSASAIVLSVGFARREKFERFEYPILIVLATLGMMMMISANDLIAVYLGLELQSLALYVLAAIHRDNARSSEAGLKYFVLGALSSGMFLYGASLIYGFAGHTDFAAIASAVTEKGASVGLIFGLVFLLTGIAFKVSAVPFHMWTPDVYEGAPTPVTAFFAAAPKVAAMAIFIRLVTGPFGSIAPDWQQIVAFLAIASMAIGSFAAIGQRNIKRLMAYSSIGHIGFALVGLAAGNRTGVQGVLIYLVIYVAMTIGSFACILAMRRGKEMVEDISELAGLARTNLPMAFLFGMIMFSLAGIPPFAGFFAKYFVFVAAIEAKLYALAVIGVLTSVVGAYYYLRIVKIMFFDEPAQPFARMPIELKVVLGGAGAFVIFFALVSDPILTMAGEAARVLFPYTL